MTMSISVQSMCAGTPEAPGQVLARWLRDHEMGLAELSRRTGISANSLRCVINGGTVIDRRIALGCECVTGIPAARWLQLQLEHDLAMMRDGPELAESDRLWLARFPYDRMERLGLVEPGAVSPQHRYLSLLRFFGVSGHDAYERACTIGSSRIHLGRPPMPPAEELSVFLRLGERAAIAAERVRAPGAALRALRGDVQTLTRLASPRSIAAMINLCIRCGVVLVPIRAPLISPPFGLTFQARGRRVVMTPVDVEFEDEFWLMLLHQLGHVAMHDPTAVYIDRRPGGRSIHAAEMRADEFAFDKLIPGLSSQVLARLSSDDQVVAFARAFGIHPGLLVAILRREQLWTGKRGEDLRVRMTPPGAGMPGADRPPLEQRLLTMYR